MAANTAVILREYLGGSEQVTYEEFAMSIVQDDEVARMVAGEMLKSCPEPYIYNEGDSQFIERFYVIDLDGLKRQMG